MSFRAIVFLAIIVFVGWKIFENRPPQEVDNPNENKISLRERMKQIKASLYEIKTIDEFEDFVGNSIKNFHTKAEEKLEKYETKAELLTKDSQEKLKQLREAVKKTKKGYDKTKQTLELFLQMYAKLEEMNRIFQEFNK